MLVTRTMITKKRLLASAALAALGAWSLTQAAGQGALAPAAPAPKFGASLDDVGAAEVPQPLPALPAPVKARADALFVNAEDVGETRALLVLRDGEPIYERYAAGFGPDSKLISWSMARASPRCSPDSVADGRRRRTGRWRRGSGAAIRAARSPCATCSYVGRAEHIENGDPVWRGDTVDMLFGPGAGDRRPLPPKPGAQPGEIFNYSSATSVIPSDILADTLTVAEPRYAPRRGTRIYRGAAGRTVGDDEPDPEFDASGDDRRVDHARRRATMPVRRVCVTTAS